LSGPFCFDLCNVLPAHWDTNVGCIEPSSRIERVKTNGSESRGLGRFVLIVMMLWTSWSLAQKEPNRKNADKLPEMQITDAGLLAIDTPEGFKRVDGPTLVFFVPKDAARKKSGVVIYVGSVPMGPSESSKDFKSAIQEDIDGFKAEYKSGSVKEEEDLDLPRAKRRAPRYTMLSGKKNNGFEQIVFIDEGHRVLMLVLSTSSQDDFARMLPLFHTFARSYGGLVVIGSKAQ